MEHRYSVHFLGVNTKRGGEAKLQFACSKETVDQMNRLVEIEGPLVFYFEGFEKDRVNGSVYSTKASTRGEHNFSFIMETPEIEKTNIGLLTPLVGLELTLFIEEMPKTV